jgi:hypothetical protein
MQELTQGAVQDGDARPHLAELCHSRGCRACGRRPSRGERFSLSQRTVRLSPGRVVTLSTIERGLETTNVGRGQPQRPLFPHAHDPALPEAMMIVAREVQRPVHDEPRQLAALAHTIALGLLRHAIE